jgi:aminoglycoside phosphotransferase (APT) family kinase protein
MQLPQPVDLPSASLDQLCRDFGIGAGEITQMVDVGIFNTVYRLGDRYVLRVPRDHPAHFEALEREALVAPKARATGIRTPELARYDPSRELLPVPYAVYELVEGTSLEPTLGFPSTEIEEPWSELGADLALLHHEVIVHELPEAEELPGASELLLRRKEEGWLSDLDADWLGVWLQRLDEEAGDVSICVTHGDIQATNVLVDETGAYRALIDWGSAKMDDPASDFAGVPLRVVPAMLSGYRAAGASVPGIEARLVRRHLQLALLLLPRGAVPGRSWAERPIPMLLETVRFFADTPPGWEALAPPARR